MPLVSQTEAVISDVQQEHGIFESPRGPDLMTPALTGPPVQLPANNEAPAISNPSRCLDAESKRYFDAVEVMRIASWSSSDRRRAFEWKVSFGFWTALVAVLAGLATGRVQFRTLPEVVLLTVIGLLAVLLHALWAIGLARVNEADLRKAYAYEAELGAVLGHTRDTTVGSELEDVRKAMRARPPIEKVWGHTWQIAITAVLAAGVIALAWIR